jgi:hypothetical protein
MSISLQGTSSLTANAESPLEIKVAQMAKSQQKREGQMAIQLLESANVTPKVSAPTASSGAHINIKV